MSDIIEIPSQCLEVTPGYVWELSLDILFENERLEDLNSWNLESVIWGKNEKIITLSKDNGLYIQNEILEDDSIIQVVTIKLTEEQTLLLKRYPKPNFSLTLTEPDSDNHVYFVGTMVFSKYPPKCL